jgi:hypothetical protein
MALAIVACDRMPVCARLSSAWSAADCTEWSQVDLLQIHQDRRDECRREMGGPEVVVDQGLITSRNPGDLEAFGAKIIEEVKVRTLNDAGMIKPVACR